MPCVLRWQNLVIVDYHQHRYCRHFLIGNIGMTEHKFLFVEMAEGQDSPMGRRPDFKPRVSHTLLNILRNKRNQAIARLGRQKTLSLLRSSEFKQLRQQPLAQGQPDENAVNQHQEVPLPAEVPATASLIVNLADSASLALSVTATPVSTTNGVRQVSNSMKPYRDMRRDFTAQMAQE